jgi:hypothetical protein
VVVANAIVAGAAVWSSFASTKAEPLAETPRQF